MEVDTGLSDFLEAFLQFGVVSVFRPKVSIGGNHAIERQNLAAPDFVHHFQPHAHILRLAFLDDTIAELGVVGSGKFVDVEKDGPVADDVVGHVMYIVDGHVVADVARDDAAVGDADRHAQIVVLQHFVVHPSDAHHAEEVVVAHHVGIKLIGHPNVIPIGCRIAVLHEAFNLIGTQMPPTVKGFPHLQIAVIVFIVTVMQILLVNEIFVYPVVIYDCYFIHLFLLVFI